MSFSRVLCVQVFRLCAIIMLRCSPRSVYIPKHFSVFEVKEKKHFKIWSDVLRQFLRERVRPPRLTPYQSCLWRYLLECLRDSDREVATRAVTSTFPSSLLRSNHAPVLYAHIIVVNDLALSSQTKKKREKNEKIFWNGYILYVLYT